MSLYVDEGYVSENYTQDGVYIYYPDYEIQVPRTEMLLVQSEPVEIRQLDLTTFHEELRVLETSEYGTVNPITHKFSSSTEIAGVPLAQVIEILEPYTIRFEDGNYNVNITGGNSNVSDRTVKNTVGVNTANSAGLQDLSSLQAASFGDGAIAIDQEKGSLGTTYPIGTRGTPARTWSDARAIALGRNMSKIIVVGTATAGEGDDISDMTVIGTNPMVSILVVYPEASTENVYITDCYFTGTLDGGTILSNCVVGDTYYFDGFIENCAIAADIIQVFGTGTLLNCTEGNKILNDPILDMSNGDSLFVRNYSGNLIVTNKTDAGLIDIHIDGMLLVDASCTDGTFNIHGNGYVVNNSNVVINDKTTGTPTEISEAVWTRNIRTVTQDVSVSAEEIHQALNTYDNKDDWKASTDHLATSLEVGAVSGQIEDSQYGNWEIVNNQMIMQDVGGSEIARFNLLDAAGNPTMRAVYKRERV